MKKIKVLFFYPDEHFGSPWTVFTHVMRYLDRTRFALYAAVNSEATGVLNLSGTDGVMIRRWKFGRGLRGSDARGNALYSAVHLPASMLALARYARTEGIDIVHCAAEARPSILGLLLARLAGARVLLHYHALPKYPENTPQALRYSGRIRQASMRATGRRADWTVTVSQFIATQVRDIGVAADRIEVVLNGVDLSRFHPGVDGSAMREAYGIPPDAPLVLELAAIIPWKRQEDLVRASPSRGGACPSSAACWSAGKIPATAVVSRATPPNCDISVSKKSSATA